MARATFAVVATSTALGLASPAAFACPSLASYSFILQRERPAASAQESVVARVEVIALVPRPGDDGFDGRSARVRVIEAVRGTRRGAEFVVGTRQATRCVQYFSRESIGEHGHIAGGIDPATGEFRGSWRRGRRVE